MSGLEEKDYVLRQLRGLAQVMARVAGLLGDGEKLEAYLALLEEEALVAETGRDPGRAALLRERALANRRAP